MERKVGEVFIHNGKTFIVEPSALCVNCYFLATCNSAESKKDFGECAARNRKDHTNIIFKELKENMETKELKVQIPEGYEIDKVKSTFENIVFKKIVVTHPKSWKEYLYKVQPTYYIDRPGHVNPSGVPEVFGDNRLCFYNRELAEKVIAYAKLLSLREEWVKGKEMDTYRYIITLCNNKPYIFSTEVEATRLSFPTKEMGEEFIDCFRDLLEKAKGLY